MATPVTYPWSGGTNFVTTKTIPILAAAPTAQTGSMVISVVNDGVTACQDTYIKEDTADTNYGTAAVLYTRTHIDYLNRSLMKFDLSRYVAAGLTKADITSATLTMKYAKYLTYDPVGNTIRIFRQQQASSAWTETGATWNHAVHDTVHWGAVGAKLADTDYDSDLYADAVCPATDIVMTWTDANGMGALVDDALDNRSNILWLLVTDTLEHTTTDEIASFVSSEGTAADVPKLTINWSRTPTVPNPYVVTIDLHKDAPTVEEDTVGWDINSRGVFHNRYPISVKTFSAMAIGDTFEVLVDTKSMVAAVDVSSVTRFFPDTAQANATKVEFVFQDGSDKTTLDSIYWTYTASGVPNSFNTGATRYFIACPHALEANTDYTFWMYFDKVRCADAASSNYMVQSAVDGSVNVQAGLFFEDFAFAAANHDAFVAGYPLWEIDTGANHPTVVTASSVLTLSGVADATVRGVATKTTRDNFHAIFRITAAPAAVTYAGIIDALGLGGADKDGFYLQSNVYWTRIVANTPVTYANVYPTAPFTFEIRKYGAVYDYCFYRADPESEPKTYGTALTRLMSRMAGTDVAMKMFVANYNTAGEIKVDSIFCYNAIEFPPVVKAPAVTYLKPGTVFCDGASCSDEDGRPNFPFDTVFALEDGTVLECGSDPMVQLTSEPGGTAQLAVRVPLDLSANQTIYCYIGHAEITRNAPHDHWGNSLAWDEYDDFTIPAAWLDDTAYVIGNRVEAAPTGIQQFYSTGGDAGYLSYGVRWDCQTFTTVAEYTITYVNLLLYRYGNVGTITVSIRATDVDGKPTGADLCVGTTNGNTLPTLTTGESRRIDFTVPVVLSATTKYAIVVRALSGTSSKRFYWKYDSTSPSYAGGSFGYSTNSGSAWTLNTSYDFIFECYGSLTSSGIAYTCAKDHNSGDYADFATALADAAWVIDWTVEAGTFVLDHYQNPVAWQSPTGNIGASPGRAWIRFPLVFSWNGRYYGIFNMAQWEYAGVYWPTPYTSVIAEQPGPGREFQPPFVRICIDPADTVVTPGGYPTSVYVDGDYPTGSIYLGIDINDSAGNYCLKVWKCTGANPLDPDNWTAVTDKVNLGEGVTHQLYKRGSTWYVIISGLFYEAGGVGAFQERHTAHAPDGWEATDFSAAATMFITAEVRECEDMGFAYDDTPGAEHTYMYYTRSAAAVNYTVLHDHLGGASVFPGNGQWDARAELTFDKASWGAGQQGSPRVYNNIAGDGYLYLYTYGKPLADDLATFPHQWCPNWIQCARGTNFTTFYEWNTDSKYKQTATGAGIAQRAYLTGTAYSDLSIIAEVQVAAVGAGGLIYRNSDTGNNFYVAWLEYVNDTTSYIKLVRYDNSVGTQLGTTYTIPEWPEAGAMGHFYLGIPWRLRVDAYGTSHKVYYSKWGGPWIEATNCAATDSTYLTGTVGVAFYQTAGAINEWKVRKIVSPEPTVGMYANVGGAGMMLSGNF